MVQTEKYKAKLIMKTVYSLAIFLFVVLISSCGDNEVSTDDAGNKIFTSEEFYWQIRVPDGWEVLSKEKRDKITYASQQYYEGNDIGPKSEGEKKIIFAMKKEGDEANSMYAFTRTYSEEIYRPSLREMLEQQYRSYASGPYDADKFLVVDTIGEYVFDRAELKLSYNGKYYLSYITYSTMIDKVNFGSSIIVNNIADKEMLTNRFKQSLESLK